MRMKVNTAYPVADPRKGKFESYMPEFGLQIWLLRAPTTSTQATPFLKNALCDITSCMQQYMVRPYTRGGFVIIEVRSGREVILFNDRESAEAACRMLNAD